MNHRAVFKKLSSETCGKFVQNKNGIWMPQTPNLLETYGKFCQNKNGIWMLQAPKGISPLPNQMPANNWSDSGKKWERIANAISFVLAAASLAAEEIKGLFGKKSEVQLLRLEMKNFEESAAEEFKSFKEENLRQHRELLAALQSNSWSSWMHGLVSRLNRSSSTHE